MIQFGKNDVQDRIKTPVRLRQEHAVRVENVIKPSVMEETCPYEIEKMFAIGSYSDDILDVAKKVVIAHVKAN